MSAHRPLVALALATLVGASCQSSAAPDGKRSLTVFAAASLRDVFTALGDEFTRLHPDVAITFNFAGTQALRTQVEHGARADVFASADLAHMQALERAGRVAPKTIFARNTLVLIVSREHATSVRSLADLAALPASARLVVGGPEVPIGRYTAELLARAATLHGPELRAAIEARVVSRELNVRQVLAKVRLGEADAGVVYATDAASAPAGLDVVSLPPELAPRAAYPIAATRDSAHPELARAFVAHVLSDAGRRTLEAAGFLPP